MDLARASGAGRLHKSCGQTAPRAHAASLLHHVRRGSGTACPAAPSGRASLAALAAAPGPAADQPLQGGGARGASAAGSLRGFASRASSGRRPWLRASLVAKATEEDGQPGTKKTVGPPPVEARHKAELESTPESFRVVGVSFEGRQELLAAIYKGQAIMLVREPHNEHDPNAVAVQTLHGHGLGYIPRDQTFRLPQQVTFGRVNSIGQQEPSGYYGLQVSVRPLLPALTVDALPAALEKRSALSKQLPAPDWDALRKAAFKRAGYKCEITGGVGPDWPVEGAGMWHVDDHAKTVRLLGVAALAPEVNAAKNLNRFVRGSEWAQAAAATLHAVNGLSPEETDAYLHHVDDQRAVRSGGGWALDVSWLSQQGVAVPLALQQPLP